MARRQKAANSEWPLKFSTIREWIDSQAHRDSLTFISCGSAGAGKSTLISYLLLHPQPELEGQSGSFSAGTRLHEPQNAHPDFSLPANELAAAQGQGQTIDGTRNFFSTSSRNFAVVDTAGAEQYTGDMVTAASMADVAVLLVDAQLGLQIQCRRHALLASLVGVRHIILAVNKMDLVGYDQQVFDTIVSEFSLLSKSIGAQFVTAIPVSALYGDNIVSRSTRTNWHHGTTLLGCLETVEIKRENRTKTAMPVQGITTTDLNFCGLSGTLASGSFKVGDIVRITASGKTAAIAKIVTADGNLQSASAGDAITVVLDKDVNASRGDVIALADQPLEMTDQFEATLIWLNEEAGLIGRTFELKLASQSSNASITSLKYRIDVATQAHESCRQLRINDIAVANLALSKPLVFEPFSQCTELGGFILIDKFSNATVAAGMIRHNLRRAQNVHRQALSITREDREKLNGHQGKVIWFTGLSGSGKSTIANALEKELHANGMRTYILDGDNIRQGINKDLGFTEADRVENIRRVAEVAKLMMDAGLVVITAFISPFRAEREMAKERIGQEHFVEVFVDTPLEVCEQRDPKGLYKKARSGQLPNMTGINSPYEKPLRPDIIIPHSSQDVDATVKLLTNFLGQ